MAKVDTDRFIALLVETYCRRQGIDRKIVKTYIDDVLENMGFKVEDGEIVELKPKNTVECEETEDGIVYESYEAIQVVSDKQ